MFVVCCSFHLLRTERQRSLTRCLLVVMRGIMFAFVRCARSPTTPSCRSPSSHLSKTELWTAQRVAVKIMEQQSVHGQMEDHTQRALWLTCGSVVATSRITLFMPRSSVSSRPRSAIFEDTKRPLMDCADMFKEARGPGKLSQFDESSSEDECSKWTPNELRMMHLRCTFRGHSLPRFGTA